MPPTADIIYLDHNATTPLDPRVLDAMLPYFREQYANPASRHAPGRAARDTVEMAREQAAALIGAQPRDIVWTSGATESNNLAIKGAARWYGDELKRGRHIVAGSTEHSAVLEPCRRLESEGFEITWIDPAPPPGPAGVVHADRVAAALRDDTILASIMWANNETGTINDIEGIGRLCKERGVHFHTDATQMVGKLPVDVEGAGVDMLSFSAHKMYGPKGAGGLYARRRRPRVRLVPLIDGGGHERGLRSGTLNVPGIVGLGAACELCGAEMHDEATRLRTLRDRLENILIERLGPDRALINGDPHRRLPHTTNLSFPGVDAEQLIAAMPGLAVSSGAACTTTSLQSSHVLRRMGLGAERARSSIRFGLGRWTTADQIDRAIEQVVRGIAEAASRGPACGTSV